MALDSQIIYKCNVWVESHRVVQSFFLVRRHFKCRLGLFQPISQSLFTLIDLSNSAREACGVRYRRNNDSIQGVDQVDCRGECCCQLALKNKDSNESGFRFSIVDLGSFYFVWKFRFSHALLFKIEMILSDLNMSAYTKRYNSISKYAAPPETFLLPSLPVCKARKTVIQVRIACSSIVDRNGQPRCIEL